MKSKLLQQDANIFVYQRGVCVYDGRLDSLKNECLYNDDSLSVKSFFKDGLRSITFKYAEKIGNTISVDNGKRIAFDRSYSIFSTVIQSAHSYRFPSRYYGDDGEYSQDGYDLQQRSFAFAPKRVDNRPKFDGALAMPAPNLI